jgi:hypothetical protein
MNGEASPTSGFGGQQQPDADSHGQPLEHVPRVYGRRPLNRSGLRSFRFVLPPHVFVVGTLLLGIRGRVHSLPRCRLGRFVRIHNSDCHHVTPAHVSFQPSDVVRPVNHAANVQVEFFPPATDRSFGGVPVWIRNHPAGTILNGAGTRPGLAGSHLPQGSMRSRRGYRDVRTRPSRSDRSAPFGGILTEAPRVRYSPIRIR